MRVIWLEDEPQRISAYAEVIRANHHIVELIKDIEEFKIKIQSGEYDIALIDVMLPTYGMFGLEESKNGLDTGLLVAKRLHQIAPDVRIVLFTNRSDAEQLNKDYGFRVLRKIDVSPWDLLRLLEDYI